MMRRRLSVLVLLCVAAALAAAAPAAAQNWPTRTAKILVPYAAGGNTDGNARLIAAALSQSLGQQFIVENRPGANGAIASELVARATPDGYTLLMSALPQMAIFPAMTKVGYDPIKDFTPISAVSTNPFVIVVNTKLIPANTLADFVNYVKARPGQVTYASAGIGSLSHLSMVLFLKAAGLEMQHAPYKGGAPAVTDVIAGQIPVYFANLSEALPHTKTDSVKLLAVSTLQRVPQLPKVPSVAESGYPGFETLTWNGLLAPAKTPKPIVDKLAAEIQRAVKDPTMRERLDAYGVNPLGNSPQEFADEIKSDVAKWAEAVRISGAKME